VDGRPTKWERLIRVNPRIWDGLLTLVLLALGVFGLWFGRDDRIGLRQRDVFAGVLLVASTLPLYWRRRISIATLVSVSTVSVGYGLLRYPSSPAISLAIAAYSVAAFRKRSLQQTASVVVALAAAVAIQSGSPLSWEAVSLGAFFNVGVPVAFGRVMWNRRRRIERDRDLAARDAVAIERARIARELHDVVAHSMSVMVVQAGAARAILRKDTEGAERALRTIEESGRTGLAEMRRLLAADRAGSSASLGPQPGLSRLDELLERMRSTGLAVETIVEGELRPLPPGVDLSAYRIVQEALTNTLKHGGDGARSRVVLRYDDDALDVEVADDGRGASLGNDAGGHGLIGMRERVALFGGDLRTEARPGGGFLVRAHIPYEEESSST
jgi:signal transduction histidine kinase